MSNANSETSTPEVNQEVNQTLPTGTPEVNQKVNQTLPTGTPTVNQEVNQTLPTGTPTVNQEVNQDITIGKPLVNQVMWLKKTMSVSASQALQQAIAETGIAQQCNNITQFTAELLQQYENNIDRLEKAQAHLKKQDAELETLAANIDELDILNEALKTALHKREAELQQLHQQHDALEAKIIKQAPLPTFAAAQAPEVKEVHFGIFNIINGGK
jgi:hypothetical protein